MRRLRLVRHDQLAGGLGVRQQPPCRRVQRVGQLLRLRGGEVAHAGNRAALLGHGGREGGAQQRLRHQRRRAMLPQRRQHQALIGEWELGWGGMQEHVCRRRRGDDAGSVQASRRRVEAASGSGGSGTAAPTARRPSAGTPRSSAPHLQAVHLRLVAILAHRATAWLRLQQPRALKTDGYVAE